MPELPHWTDPPTGQVPAVLDRRGDDEGAETQWSAAGDTGPAWREHQHEWDDSGFDPSLLADDDTRVGALEETPVEERRPWEFDDLNAAVADEDRWEAEHDVGSDRRSWWDEEDGAMAEPPCGGGPRRGPRVPHAARRRRRRRRSSGGWPRSAPRRCDRGRDPGASSALSGPRGPLPRRNVVPPGAPARRFRAQHARRHRHRARVRAVAVLCFEAGTVATLVLVTVVVALAAAECYAALRRGGKRPATLLGLVATVAIMVAAYSKGIVRHPSACSSWW